MSKYCYPHFTDEKTEHREVKKFAQENQPGRGRSSIQTQLCVVPKPSSQAYFILFSISSLHVPVNFSFPLFLTFMQDFIVEGFPGGSVVKNPPAKQETWVLSLDKEDLLEKEPALVFLPEKSHRQRRMSMGVTKESDTTE